MADIQLATLNAIQSLDRAIRDLPNTIMAAGTKVPRTATNKEKFKFDSKNPSKDQADQKRLAKAMEDQATASKKLFTDINKISSDMLIAGGMFNKAVDHMSFKTFEQLPSKLNDVIGNLHGEIKSYEDVLRVQRRSLMSNVNAAEQLYQEFMKLDPNVKGYQKAVDTIAKEMDKTGYSLEDFSGYTADAAGTMKKLNENAKEGAKGLKEVADSSASVANRGKALGKIFSFLGGAALEIGQYFLNSAKAAMKYGTVAAPVASLLAGMTPSDFAKLQKDNIQAARSGFKSLTEFNAKVDAGASSLFDYTGSLEAGARLTASNLSTFRTFSNNTSMQNDFVEKQNKIFISMNRTISTTAEEFQQLNEQLLNNNDVQAQLYKLDSQQRIAYFQDLELATKRLQIEGLSQEAAMKVVSTFQQLAGQTPQERLKQAAKLQAIGGAIGLNSPDLNKLADLIRSGARTPEAMQEMADIEGRIQPQLQAITANQSATLGTETSFRALVDQVPELLGANNIAAGLGITGKGLNQTQENSAMTTDFLGKLAGPNGEVMNGFSQTVAGIAKVENVMSTVGIDLKNTISKGFGMIGSLMIGNAALKGLGRFFPGLGGGAAEGGAIAEGAATAGGLGVAATAIAGAAITGAASYGLTTLITSTIPKALGAKEGLGEWIGGKIADHVFGNFKQPVPPSQTGHETGTKALTAQIHALSTEVAKLGKEDAAAKAVDKLHKTVKDQHQEDKTMTQEQIDAYNKTHKVIMSKTTRDILGPSY